MAWIISTQYTQSDYVQSLTLNNINARTIILHIYGAAVITQSQVVDPGWGTELLLPPGVYTMHKRYRGFRVKSAIPGLPALVSIEAVSSYE